MDASHAGDEAQQRFERLLRYPTGAAPSDVVVEKTPINSLRIGYLEALAPGARYIHIVRDGIDVARSIERLAETNEYKIAGQKNWNQWWGDNDSKWNVLARDGAAAGYYPEEVPRIEDHRARGAYEWLTSLSEVDRWRETLGSRLMEFTYDALTSRPTAVLSEMAQFMGLEADEAWLEASRDEVGAERHNDGPAVCLPERMTEDFNRLQRRYQFTSRAEPMSVPMERTQIHRMATSQRLSIPSSAGLATA